MPNFLKRCGRYFEAKGLCFVVSPVVHDRAFYWLVAFQNRYAKPCQASLSFQPAATKLGFSRPDVPPVHLDIECDGGAYGVAEIPSRLPLQYQGRKMRFVVAGASHYPRGRGRMLLFRDGMRVGSRHASGFDLAVTAAVALTGHVHSKSDASFRVVLPLVGVNVEASGAPRQEIRWRPGDAIEAPSAQKAVAP